MPFRNFVQWLILLLCPVAVAAAQDFPQRPIRIVTSGTYQVTGSGLVS